MARSHLYSTLLDDEFLTRPVALLLGIPVASGADISIFQSTKTIMRSLSLTKLLQKITEITHVESATRHNESSISTSSLERHSFSPLLRTVSLKLPIVTFSCRTAFFAR